MGVNTAVIPGRKQSQLKSMRIGRLGAEGPRCFATEGGGPRRRAIGESTRGRSGAYLLPCYEGRVEWNGALRQPLQGQARLRESCFAVRSDERIAGHENQ
jgi:hypothetical protein